MMTTDATSQEDIKLDEKIQERNRVIPSIQSNCT